MLSSGPVPVNWRSGIAAVLAMAGGYALGGVFNPSTGAITAVTGMLIAAVGAQGSLGVGVRSVVTIGAAVWVAVILARLTFMNPWAAALAMAVVAFLSTIVQAVPLIGMPLGMMPALAFFIITIKDWGSAADIAMVGGASLLAIVTAALAVVLVNLPDPTRASRRIVAATFRPETPMMTHGLARGALRLESEPRLLTAILRAADRISLARSLVQRAAGADQRVLAALSQADAASALIAQTLQPRGRIAGRDVPDTDLTALDAAIDNPEIGAPTRLGLENLRAGLADAAALVEGRLTPQPGLDWPSPIRWLLRAMLNPDASWFRYGVQRAVALGLGVLIFKLLNPAGAEVGFWVLLTLFLVLQPNHLATARRAFQRGAGTVVAVGLAVLLSLVLPPIALMPYATALCILAGVAFIGRNPAMSAAFIATAVAFMVGVPAHNVTEWVLWRLAATIVGCVLALLVTTVVLRARAHPRARAAAVRAALSNLLDALAASAAPTEASPTRTPLCAYAAIALTRLDSMRSERSLLRDKQLIARYDEVSDRLGRIDDDCGALSLASLSDLDSALVNNGIEHVRERLAQVDQLIMSLPQRG